MTESSRGDNPKPDERARVGWESDFPTFRGAHPGTVRESLREFVRDASPEQVNAWTACIPPLQREVQEVLDSNPLASQYSTILEYELPLDSRRSDVVLLVGAAVMVLELKGKLEPSQADLDQVAAYTRDLECYHRDCEGRRVVPVLVSTRAKGYVREVDGIHIIGPDALDDLIGRIAAEHSGQAIARERFLEVDAYRPLPTIVEAARELMESRTIRELHPDRARAATDPAVEEISRIIHAAALSKSRHLILVTGVPGAGKTLVGLRTVHAKYLDDLAIERAGGKPTAPAVFLSGNGPLVQVLQHVLRGAGGGGQTFVRPVRDYVKRYSRPGAIPPEHVLVFDEAQRAFDAVQMGVTHGGHTSKSEPGEFIDFAVRIPQWCVVIGLVGSGQEIHVGEEAGIGQWADAIASTADPTAWAIHCPPQVVPEVRRTGVSVEARASLSLDTELRFHAASDLHAFVADLLEGTAPRVLREKAERLEASRYHLRITRSLPTAKKYLRERYREDPQARFGLIASSKDKALEAFGVPNGFQATRRVKVGPWYGSDEDDYDGLSCRLLETCVTEFGAQGLELDAALLAWGSDFIRLNGVWSNATARGYQQRANVRDPFQLRLNAYRVLLTRGRDGTVVFVPPVTSLDQTYNHLIASGFRELRDYELAEHAARSGGRAPKSEESDQDL